MFTIIESTPTDNLVQTGLTIVLAVATALALSGIFKAGARPWQLVTLMALPVALVFLNDGYRDSQWHVLCEKPLATTVQDCRSIVEAARRYRRTLGTGFNYRFYPAIAKARELIAEGRIGELDHVKSFAGHPGGPEFTHQWVHDSTIMGGGALMDNGIHVADLTLHFLGEVLESHRYCTERVWRFRGSEDNGYVLMRTSQGVVGMLHASWTEWPGYRFSVDIYGTEGCIHEAGDRKEPS